MLLRKISGNLLLLWDSSQIHRGQEVKALLKPGAAKHLHLEHLSCWAPDLNPDEGVWNYLKHVELCNVCSLVLNRLSAALIRFKECLLHKREIIQSCSRQCGYLIYLLIA